MLTENKITGKYWEITQKVEVTELVINLLIYVVHIMVLAAEKIYLMYIDQEYFCYS